MLHEESSKKREQISMVCIDELVPQDHLLRKIERVIDWSFIYELVKEKYSPDFGRPSVDPVILIKIVIIQYLYGIRSMRQTIRETQKDASCIGIRERSLIECLKKRRPVLIPTALL